MSKNKSSQLQQATEPDEDFIAEIADAIATLIKFRGHLPPTFNRAFAEALDELYAVGANHPLEIATCHRIAAREACRYYNRMPSDDDE